MRKEIDFLQTLATREQVRDRELKRRGAIGEERLLCRAQKFRHLTHVISGQSILELACGDGLFTRKLVEVTRGENPITAIKFRTETNEPPMLSASVEVIQASGKFPDLEHKQFDLIVSMDLLDQHVGPWLMEHVYQLLKPGGQFVSYEYNPWNVFHKLRAFFPSQLGQSKLPMVLSRSHFYELMSEIGFVRVFSVYQDLAYGCSDSWGSWLFRNLSAVLENVPGLRTCAQSILIHGQKPPRKIELSPQSLFVHESLRQAISIVIPCRNEEQNIEALIARLRNAFGEYIHEMILVDDNSEDQTRAILQKMAQEDSRIKSVYRSPPNGVGHAIADGYRVATGRYILSMDCDFQYLVPELRDLFDAASEGYEVAIGSRFSRHSVQLNYGFRRAIPNRMYHLIAQIMLLRPFRDLTNNLKLVRQDVVKKLQLTEPGFAINAEIGLQVVVMGCRVKEVPISWVERTFDMGIPSFSPIQFGWGYWRVLYRLWIKCVFGVGLYKTLPMPKRHGLEKFRETFFMKNV